MSSSDHSSNGTDESRTTGDSWPSKAALLGGGLLVVGLAALLTLGVLRSVFGAAMMGGGMMGGGMMINPWLWLLATAVPLAVLAIGGYAVWQATTSTTADAEPAADPLEILEARYLDDEIDLAEYETRLGHLFDLAVDDDTHPRVSRLAIQYARGEIDRDTLADRLDTLQSEDASVQTVDPETVVRNAATLDPSDRDTAASSESEQSTAIQRLRRRYADGEMDHDEYKQRLTTLRETASEEA